VPKFWSFSEKEMSFAAARSGAIREPATSLPSAENGTSLMVRVPLVKADRSPL
jgi:hypothetical protein